MERTMSWLWEAFSGCEHLSIIFEVSCQLKVCHIWKIPSSQTMRCIALDEGFSALLRTQFPSPTSLTRACCHLVDSHRLVPPHSSATRWSVTKEFWIPTFLGVQQLRFSKSQKVTGPELPWNWGGFYQLLSVAWEIPGYRFSSVIMKYYRKILPCQHNLHHLRGFYHSCSHLLHWNTSGGNSSYTTCILLV